MPSVLPDFSEVAPTIVRENTKAMLEVREFDGKTEVRINSSSLGVILSCPRKSYYVLHRKLRAKSEAPALLFGLAIHKALEIFYSAPSGARSIPADFKSVSDLMAHWPAENRAAQAKEHFLFAAIDGFVTAAQALKHLPDSDKRSIPNGIWILQEYFKTYINDPYVVYRDANGPVTERTCEAVLFEDASIRIILFGTIDLVLKNEIQGNIMPADHKTTSIIGSDFFSRLKPNHQYTGYLYLAREVLGIDSSEFLVNALQVKPKPVTARGSGPHFTRQPTTRTDQDFTEFISAVRWAVRSYLIWMREEEWPIGHVNECSSYGGCGFIEICGAPGKLRENLIEAKFDSPKGT